VPLTCINKIDKTVFEKKVAGKSNYIEIFTKDYRYIKLIVDTIEDCNNAHQRIQLLAFPEAELHDIFAFSYFYPTSDIDKEYLENGWDIYNSPDLEFKRQGIVFGNVRQNYSRDFNLLFRTPNLRSTSMKSTCSVLRTLLCMLSQPGSRTISCPFQLGSGPKPDSPVIKIYI
jgi:hypothetical protein